MGFSFENLTRWLLPVGVVLAVVNTAKSQPAERSPGQAILFSSPDDDNVSSNMPSLVAKPPGLLDFANEIESPTLKFGVASGAGTPPAPRLPDVSPSQFQRMQRMLDERKNWALMTPEEILGVPTQEKILGIPDRDASGNVKDETVEEQYYEREERLRDPTNNADFGMADSAAQWGLSDGQQQQMNPNILSPAGGKPDSSGLMSQFVNRMPDDRTVPGQSPASGWSRSFNLPEPPPGPTPEQQAAMEQFQQLLQPHSSPVSDANAPASGSPFFSSPSAVAVSGQPAAIPVGASYVPLSSGIAMPAGVTPLPGLLGPTNMGLTTRAPEWKPELPPWLSSGPQPGVIPQRKF
jgi:hypothetical protein